MKKLLFSIALAVSLIIGSTSAFAEVAKHDNTRGNSMAQGVGKGLDKPIFAENGKDSWVLHQPQKHELQYFSGTSQGETAKESNNAPNRQRS